MIYQHNRISRKGVEPEKTTFYIIRHGETPLNQNDEIRGWLDVPLAPEGRRRAYETGKELKKAGVECLYVSDLKRTRETAEEIHRASGIPIAELSFWLRPWNLGKYTGKPVKESIASIQHYASDEPLTPIPDGESFHEFMNRFFEGLMCHMYEGRKVGLVTHHRDDRLFAAWEAAGKKENRELDLDVMFEKGINPGTWRKEGTKISTKGSDQ